MTVSSFAVTTDDTFSSSYDLLNACTLLSLVLYIFICQNKFNSNAVKGKLVFEDIHNSWLYCFTSSKGFVKQYNQELCICWSRSPIQSKRLFCVLNARTTRASGDRTSQSSKSHASQSNGEVKPEHDNTVRQLVVTCSTTLRCCRVIHYFTVFPPRVVNYSLFPDNGVEALPRRKPVLFVGSPQGKATYRQRSASQIFPTFVKRRP